jgi:NAD(P)-dependent dehydrogenase (short-subunit alcohol dehydrogenase family)
MKRLNGKSAIVTGAGAGLGRAIALLFAKEGALVTATDIHPEGLASLEAEVIAEGGKLIKVIGDVSAQNDVKRIYDEAQKAFGTVDILINNAGIMDHFDPVGDVDDELWNRVMSVNVTGPMRMMREAVRLMLPKGAGAIVNISSVGGLQGARAGAAYTASKHALNGLTKNTGYMYSKLGLRCNAIAAGAMETGILAGFDFGGLTPLIQQQIMAASANNPRASKPVEVANLTLFLASDEASFVNGAIIVADGGWTAY